MARIDTTFQGPGGMYDGTAHNVITLQASEGPLHLPSNEFIAHADIARDGYDLILTGPDGSSVVVEGYFLASPPPMLTAPSGEALTPDLVEAFVHQASGVKLAGLDTADDASAVGTVKEVSGHATITHPDGTKEMVVTGMPVHEGDIIETDAKGAVNLVFVDESSFAVSENAKLAIDQYVFDPGSDSGTSNFSMLRGLFVYTSGLIGREDPDDVKIETPVGSIGIRGTVIAGNVSTGEISVVEGAIVLHSLNGDEVTLSGQYETARFDPQSGTVAQTATLSAADISAKFSGISSVAPAFYSGLGEGHQPATENNQQNNTAPSGSEGQATPASEQPAPAGNSQNGASSNTGAAPADQAAAPAPAAAEPPPVMIDSGSATANAFGDTGTFSSTGSSTSFSAPATVTTATTAPTSSASAPPPPAPAPSAPPPATAAPVNTAPTINTQPPPPANNPPPPPNAAPVATNATFSVSENAAANTSVGQVMASDSDAGQALTYSIVGGNTGNVFAINSATGAITVAGALNYEALATYNLTVLVTDNGANPASTTANITVNIGNVNEAPIVAAATASAAENATIGTTVHNATATDQDTGQTLTWSIVSGNTGNAFAINSATGAITVAGILDYEALTTYNLVVQATDNGTGALSGTNTITINVTDANDLTPSMSGSTFSVSEKAAVGTAVGTASATDGDTVGTLTYSIISGNAGNVFAINSTTGAITIADTTNLDFETTSTYTLTVQVSDGVHTANAVFTVNIQDFPELQSLASGQGFMIKDDINEMFGSSLTAMGDKNGDGFDDLAIIKEGDDLVFFLQGQATAGSNMSVPTAGSFNSGFSNTQKLTIAHAGDFDGDGIQDFVIGAPHAADANNTSDSGQIKIMNSNGTVLTQLTGLGTGDLTGLTVSGIGDINRDGYDDVAVGAPGAGSGDAGKTYILYGGDKATINPVIDVNGMNSVRVVGAEAPASPADFVIKGNYAFVISSTNDALNILDISNPSLPTVVGNINNSDISIATSAAITNGMSGAMAVAVQGNYAYVAATASSRLTIIDISTPNAPVYVSSMLTNSNPNDIAVRGNIALLTSHTDDTVEIVNISNPASPSVYYAYVLNISDPTAVAFSASGQYAYIGNSGNDTMTVLNLTTPASPSTATTVTMPAGVDFTDMFLDGKYLYLTDTANDRLYVYDVSNETSPTLVSFFTDGSIVNPTGVTVSNGIAYVTSGDTVTMIDVHNPASMTALNSYSDNAAIGGASAVAVDSHGLVHVLGLNSDTYTILDTRPDGSVINGSAGLDMAGAAVTGVGDVNHDGFSDFAIGLSKNGNGEVHIVLGSPSGGAVTLNSGTFAIRNIATDLSDTHMPVMYAGDMNGDGLSDMIVGASGANGGKGLAYVIYGSNSMTAGGSLDASAGFNGINGFTITTGGSAQGIEGGGAVGDFNGDGYDDMAVVLQAPGSRNVDLYVVFGQSNGASDGVLNLTELNDPTNAYHMSYTIPSTVANPDNFDFNISAAGDLNGDGFADFAVGLPNLDNNNSTDSSGNSNPTDDQDGSTVIVYGRPTGLGTIVTDNSAADANAAVGSVTASAADQTLIGGSNNMTLSDNGFAGTVFRGGAGNDILQFRAINFLNVDGGGSNSDVLKYMMSGGTVDFSAVGREDIRRIEALDMGGTTQTMRLTLANIFDLMSESDSGTLKISSSGSPTSNTLILDNQTSGSQAGANAAQIGSMLGASQVEDLSTTYAFHFGGSALIVDKALVDNGHVNIA